jgi:hypothetical protein
MDLSAIESTELLAAASQRAARNPHSVHDAPVSAYLDWALTPGRFCHVVVAAESRSWLQRLLGGTEALPQMTTDLGMALARQPDLLKLARAGFRLLIGSRDDDSSEEDFLCRIGYSRAGASMLDGKGVHDPLSAAWNRRSLEEAVQLALAWPCRTVCIFGHDGDPVYLLRSVRDVGRSATRLVVNAG